MKELIRQRARELGFDGCRFTTACPPGSKEQFEQWLDTGRHGEMAYLQRNGHKRVDPQIVLPGAMSIICLAASYHLPQFQDSSFKPEAPAIDNPRPAGVIARYARFTDYHDGLSERLKALNDFVNQTGGESTRSLWYVDTGPILERDLAERAGLGFIGKHTNLISRKLGNWIFLAEILTTVKLEPDPSETNHCGSCVRCITACPTQAITAPFQLDARRCISYLTIELKGPIPIELRPAIGNRIYGCDDCLAVCPWNRFAKEGSILTKQVLKEPQPPDLLDLLQIDEQGFKQRFAGTPMLRTKRKGLLRNVCVALGNTADSTAIPALERAANDREPLIAEHARWAIDQIEKR
jgi:epoxyqueuosine reductase